MESAQPEPTSPNLLQRARALLERSIRPRNPESADAWRERLIYIFLNLLVVTSILTFVGDAFTSLMEGLRGLVGVAITIAVRLLAERNPRIAGWLLVLAGALFVRFALGAQVLEGTTGGLTLGILAVLGSAFIAPWAGLPVALLTAVGVLPFEIATYTMIFAVGGAVWILTALIEGALRRYEASNLALQESNVALRVAQTGLEQRVQERTSELELAKLRAEGEQERADELLRVIMPPQVVEELKVNGRVLPRRYDLVGVLSCDIVNFTEYCEKHPPELVIRQLQELVEAFEELSNRYYLDKIKTSGDEFIATAGMFHRLENPVLSCLRCGLDMVRVAPTLSAGWHVHVGVNFGPIIGGVIGRHNYLFDILGDTVNLASRLQDASESDEVCLSFRAWSLVSNFGLSDGPRRVSVKGKGVIPIYPVRALREIV